ncbi:hypothetical protein PINS_up006959 [Pythium insidiosum]|nr:hypothetical protein PINS_up006959 [Pythium insidiosum]
MASNLKELMNQNISIITNDGRNIIGVLKGYDQCINVVLDNSFERVYSLKEPVEACGARAVHRPRRQHRCDRRSLGRRA